MKAIGPPPLPAGWNAPELELPRAASLGQGTQLWFVRHAEVAERWHDTAYGSMNVELSERGEEQTLAMEAAFREVPLQRVLSSDLDRALRMGEGVARATGAPITISESLREMDRGDWQGMPKSEFVALWEADAESYWSDPYRWHVPAGEGDQRLFERAYPLVEEALAAAPGSSIAITAHGQLIRVLISRFLGLDVPQSYDYYPDPAHATCLVDGASGWELLARNRAPQELCR